MNKNKKALIITEVFYPEDFVINDLFENWLEQKFSFEVFCRNPSYPKDKIYKGYKNTLYSNKKYKDINIHRIYSILGYQKNLFLKISNYLFFFLCNFIFLLLNFKKYDKIFIYQTGPLSNALSACMLKFIGKYEIAIWTQDLWPDTIYAYGFKKNKFSKFFLNNLVKFIYTKTDKILVSCRGFDKKIQKFVKKETLFVPNWSLVEYKPTGKNKLKKGCNFTFAGNIGSVQNLENIVLSFKKINNKNQNIYLNIIGDGSYLNKIKDIVIKNNIKNINFTGRESLKSISDYFYSSDFLIISLAGKEIFKHTVPAKFQAYLATQKPIFGIIEGEVSNIILKNNLGVISNPNNINSIVKGFKKCLNLNENEKNKISLNCKKLLLNDYNKEKIIEKINKIFWK